MENNIKRQITNRFVELIDFLVKSGYTASGSAFMASIGEQSQALTDMKSSSKNRYVSIEMLYSAKQKYDFNFEWIISGKGEMVSGNRNRPIDSDISVDLIQQGSYKTTTTLARRGNQEPNIYYVPNPAMAGIYEKGIFDYQHLDLSKIYIPGFENGSDDKFLFQITGESMYPFLSNGDMVIAVKIHSVEDIKPGYPYVICTPAMMVVKRVLKSKKVNCLLLVSDNPDHDPYDQHVEDITHIFLVKGAITLNTSKRNVMKQIK